MKGKHNFCSEIASVYSKILQSNVSLSLCSHTVGYHKANYTLQRCFHMHGFNGNIEGIFQRIENFQMVQMNDKVTQIHSLQYSY